MFCLCLLTAFSCIFRIFLVSLPKEFLKKGYNMALKIKNREEEAIPFWLITSRKRKWRNKFKKNLPKYVKKQS